FECLPADEAVSMIYLTLQFLFPDAESIHQAPVDPDDAREDWQIFFEAFADDYYDGNNNNVIARTVAELQAGRKELAPEAVCEVVHDAIGELFAKMKPTAVRTLLRDHIVNQNSEGRV